jgi:ribosomal protein L21E
MKVNLGDKIKINGEGRFYKGYTGEVVTTFGMQIKVNLTHDRIGKKLRKPIICHYIISDLEKYEEN